MTDSRRLTSRLLAEFVGTAFLLAAVVGSGIMAENLTDDMGLQLFQNAFATAGVLIALILALGPASGAHFNPAVTLADRLLGGISTRDAVAYIGGAYYFTSSTSFANPAVTLARTMSDTFAGIDPSDAAPFIAAELVGALLAVVLVRLIYPDIAAVANRVVVPHGD